MITNLERIKTVLEYYLSHGINKESVNKVYRKILKIQNYDKYNRF